MRLTLRRALQASRWRDVRLVGAGCFSLCPPGGVVLSTVPKAGGRRLMVLTPGADADAALDYLLRPTRATSDPS